ncbi:hypothetical protein MMC29_002534 [Sticta canariensis]|nr:hypothetical protein [Sticta canariensis]
MRESPNEVLLQIFSHLARSDWKSIRRLSKKWSVTAAKPVLDEIRLAPTDQAIASLRALSSLEHLRLIPSRLRVEAKLVEPNLIVHQFLQHLLRQIRLCSQCWLASSSSRSYVAKPVAPFLYNQAFRLREDLEFSPFVRLPVDGSDADHTLIFQHYTEDFLNVKPSNATVLFTSGPDGARNIHGVSLSDTEKAAKVESGKAIFAQVSNVLWRSPEAQTGTRMGKASDVWSFGVTVSTSLLSTSLPLKFEITLTTSLQLSQAVYGITRMVIFAYDKLDEDVLPEVEVLKQKTITDNSVSEKDPADVATEVISAGPFEIKAYFPPSTSGNTVVFMHLPGGICKKGIDRDRSWCLNMANDSYIYATRAAQVLDFVA